MSPRLAFIGFGEAGQAIAEGLRTQGVEQIAVWDILFSESGGVALKEAAENIGVRVAMSAQDAVHDADMVIAAVTAASSAEAARSVAAHLRNTPFYLDVNSVSPGRKRETAALLGDAARYVDVAIVSAIHPAKHKSPMMLAGPHAGAAALVMEDIGMRVGIVGETVGAAAAIKMVRSVMIKGIEALTLECFLAAQNAGVVDEVAASLKNNYPALDWDKIAPYNIERMASHGIRRAAEMRESAQTLRELGVDPLMTQGTIARQQQMGELGRAPGIKDAVTKDRAAMLTAISDAVKATS